MSHLVSYCRICRSDIDKQWLPDLLSGLTDLHTQRGIRSEIFKRDKQATPRDVAVRLWRPWHVKQVSSSAANFMMRQLHDTKQLFGRA